VAESGLHLGIPVIFNVQFLAHHGAAAAVLAMAGGTVLAPKRGGIRGGQYTCECNHGHDRKECFLFHLFSFLVSFDVTKPIGFKFGFYFFSDRTYAIKAVISSSLSFVPKAFMVVLPFCLTPFLIASIACASVKPAWTLESVRSFAFKS